jgi:hypothetical protein
MVRHASRSGAAGDLGDLGLHERRHLHDVPLDERGDERLLARVVLVERPDADAGGCPSRTTTC